MIKRILIGLICCAAMATSWADPGVVWHEPADAHPDLGGPTMRDPLYEAADNDLTIYQGFHKAGGANGDQNGGALYYRFASGAWSSTNLSWHSDVDEDPHDPNTQYWTATLPSTFANPTNVIEYYIKVTFSGASPDTTYLYGGDLKNNSSTTTNEAIAQANPYSIRNRPGWIYHNDNRIIAGDDIQIRLKTGYIGPDNDPDTLWATDGAIYYTTDGSDPAGSLGTATNTSIVAALSFDGTEGDASGNGNAAYWSGTMANVLSELPLGGQVKYKVSLWNSANNEEKFGDDTSGTLFTYQNGQVGGPVLTVNGLNANYTTSKLFVDEIAGDSINVDIVFQPSESNIVAAEVYSNLNRRDRADDDANADGYADGISGLDGDSLVAGDDNHYYKAYTMTPAGAGTYTLTLPASKTGAYRLSARFKTSDAITENGDDPNNWIWYGLRDHAIVVSPIDARDVRLYEINVFNVDASGDTFAQRSTLEDLYDAPGAAQSGEGNWNLDYLKRLGLNWLWFQPIHPNGFDGREPSDGWGGTAPVYDPGSPYAVKNFFAVNELMTVNYNSGNTLEQNRAAAMTAWSAFVASADSEEVGIMLDAPFNHTAFDVELAQQGVDLFQPDGETTWSPYDEIRNRDTRFFSADGNYGNRASSITNIAAGPDRNDFGKWNDVKDVFFGVYDALVEYDDSDDGGAENSSYTSEGDWFDATDTDWTNNDFVQNSTNKNVTKLVWNYFAEYAIHWLEQTRPAGQNRNSTAADGDATTRYAWDKKGIDGLRCDFGQGLPPRCWEYIINVARSHKWNFVMMSESLDGGAVTYRSNRQFDILNENTVFALKAEATTNTWAYRSIFEDRRSAYGQGLVLLNNASHDEETLSDPWESVVRSAVVGMMDGATLIFPGQELGISTTYGYDQYETNFGKQVPHFKRWNSMAPIWADTNYGNDQLFPVYSGIQSARASSPALRSSSRWFLDGDGNNTKIFATAKYEEANASPAISDVVIGFANLDRDNDQSDNFKIPAGLATLLGLQDGRTYNVKNIAAHIEQDPTRRDQWLWETGISGADLQSGGFTVFTKKVPTIDGDWATAPYEAQYLKVYDVTAPVATPAQPGKPNTYAYELGDKVVFDWADIGADAEGVVPHYEIIVTANGSPVSTNVTAVSEYEVTASEGDTVSITVKAVNPEYTGNSGPSSTASDTVTLLDASADEDEDGQTNGDEHIAGTNPLSSGSVFKLSSLTMDSGGDVTATWGIVAGKTYSAQTRGSLTSGSWTTVVSNLTTGTWVDPSPSETKKFYRIRVTD